ncbi:glycoside hydrolase family 9 protein [Lyophyllum atratum]|nr:glycoside hydrolase family 9 protein [Lyophyllum atratum]
MLYTLLYGLALLFFFTSCPVSAQLTLPNPPFIPPVATDGARQTTGRLPNPQWSTLLGNLLYFYEAQRNYIKATYPLSATLMSICWGATDYGKAYDATNQTSYLDDMLRWGLDWLMKVRGPQTILSSCSVPNGFGQCLLGWRPEHPILRPSYQINNTNPGTDAAAGASAAFSACSNLYSNRGFGGPFSSPASLQNSSYGEKLLTHAQQLYSFAVNATGGQRTYQTSISAIAASYGSSSYGDDLTLAALLLSRATNSSSLFHQAEDHYRNFNLAGQNGVFNWDSKTPGLAVLFAQIIQSSNLGGNLTAWQAEAERYFDGVVNTRGPGYLTKNGLLYYDGDSDSASLNPALNAAMLLTRYAPIAVISGEESFISLPYIVGSHPNSPSNPHSAMAAGGNDISNIDTSPEKEAYVLYGAVIGGPNKHDNYYDIRSDWPETEVLGAYENVRPKGLPCDPVFPNACAGPQLSKGGKIAMAVSVTVVGLTVFALVAWYIYLLVVPNAVKAT